jgi:ribokinase
MAADRQSRPVVVIVGSVNVDLVVAAERLPGRGETVLGPRLERYGGAMGANAAVTAARLGAQARLVAAVGDDALGRKRSRSCATRASTLRE